MRRTRLLSVLTALALVLGLAFPAGAAVSLEDAVEGSAAYLARTVKYPQVSSIGGEWAVIGLARSGCGVPEGYYEDYYATVEAYVKACGGVLHKKKYTEYSRVALALTAIGKDPTNVGGYDLLAPLADFEKTVWQGLNGPVWALIALDSGGYAIPENPDAAVRATRQMYVDEILSCQLEDGGFNLLSFGAADTDMTGMALQALAKYQDQPAVKEATERALDCLSKKQNESGGFNSWGTTNSESVVQVIVALTELGIPLDDSRFVKNGRTLVDDLLTYRRSDGSFTHVADGADGSNQMATEQGFYGLVAALRAAQGRPSLYRMTDALSIGAAAGPEKGTGLPGKSADVKPVPITAPGTTFDDIISSDNITAIEALAARGIISGMGDGTFAPDETMSRAQFATIVTRALGLTPEDTGVFSDVAASAWYAGYIGTANRYGIVAGRGGGIFDPNGTITRQEAACMVARAAKLCGMDTELSGAEILNMLAQFGDYRGVADWARGAAAFCYREDILDQSDLEVRPTEPILRCEIAQMLFNMLTKANLL